MDFLGMMTQQHGPLFLTRETLTEMKSRELTPGDRKRIKKEIGDLEGVRSILTESLGNLPSVSPEIDLIFKEIKNLLGQYRELQSQVPR